MSHADASQLAVEARDFALEEVCRLLQNPEDLTRLASLRAEYEKGRAANQLQLASLVQSRVEAAQSSRELLDRSHKAVSKLKSCFEHIDRLCEECASLVENHEKIQELAVAHHNVAKTLVEIDDIIDLPSNAVLAEDMLSDDALLIEAFKALSSLEGTSSLVQEAMKKNNRRTTEQENLKDYFDKVGLSAKKFEAKLWEHFSNFSTLSVSNPGLLVACNQVVEIQEFIDKELPEEGQKAFKRQAFESMEQSIKDRFETVFQHSKQLRHEGETIEEEHVTEILEAARRLSQQLVDIYDLVEPCFPTGDRVFDRLWRCYHLNFGTMLEHFAAAASSIDNKSILDIVRWVESYSETLRGLGVEEAALKLPGGLNTLIDVYIDRDKRSTTAWYLNILDSDITSEPKTDKDEKLWTPGFVDFFRILNDAFVAVERETHGEMLLQSAQSGLQLMDEFIAAQTALLQREVVPPILAAFANNNHRAYDLAIEFVEHFDTISMEEHTGKLDAEHVYRGFLDVAKLAMKKLLESVFTDPGMVGLLKKLYQNEWQTGEITSSLIATLQDYLEEFSVVLDFSLYKRIVEGALNRAIGSYTAALVQRMPTITETVIQQMQRDEAELSAFFAQLTSPDKVYPHIQQLSNLRQLACASSVEGFVFAYLSVLESNPDTTPSLVEKVCSARSDITRADASEINEQFAAELHTRRQVATAELYTFTKTDVLGERLHGFCRKIFWSPTIRGPKFPIVLCLMSSELWTTFHFKVLEVVEGCLRGEGLLAATPVGVLPLQSATVTFLKGVNQKLGAAFEPGATLTLTLPSLSPPLEIDPPMLIKALDGRSGDALRSTSEFIQLQIPPLLGGSEQMAGVALARLLWHVPVQCLMTLIASLLLERHIIMISKNKETVSAAIHAASALIYPFEWSSTFYLPLLPEKLRDYLQAPFPFLVGLPAELMDFKGLEIDQVTIIDLDLGVCIPESGSPEDDAQYLPKRKLLQEELHAAVKALRSPTEFEGNMRVAEVMTSYMVRLFKNYRQFIRSKELAQLRERGYFSVKAAPRQNRGIRGARSELHTETLTDIDGAIDAESNFFDHSKFVASHKSKKDRAFLEMLRQSQLYEVFIRQRLGMAKSGVYPQSDPFENKITLIQRHVEKGATVLRHWSRRLPSLPTARREIRKTQTQVIRDGERLDLDELLMSMPSLQRLPKLPSVRRRPSSRRFFEGKSLKNIVAEISREASKKLELQPGNYLTQSRASCPIPDTPERERPPATPRSFSPSLLIESETDSSDELPPTELIEIPERHVSGIDLTTSPWNASPDEHLFDAFQASEQLPVEIATSGTESPASMREVQLKRMVMPEPSFRLGVDQWNLQQQIPKEMRFQDEQPKHRAEDFVESNLKGLEKDNVVHLGLPPKQPKLQFRRSNAFTFK